MDHQRLGISPVRRINRAPDPQANSNALTVNNEVIYKSRKQSIGDRGGAFRLRSVEL